MAGWTLSEVILTDVELRAGKTVVDGGMRVLQNKDKLNAMSNGAYEDYEEETHLHEFLRLHHAVGLCTAKIYQ